jgi:hypothetical protein
VRGALDFPAPRPGEIVLFGFGGLGGVPLFDLGADSIAGPTVRRHLRVGTGLDDWVALPAGLALRTEGEAAPADFAWPFLATAPPGPRRAWAIAARLPFDRVIALLTFLAGDCAAPCTDLTILSLVGEGLSVADWHAPAATGAGREARVRAFSTTRCRP